MSAPEALEAVDTAPAEEQQQEVDEQQQQKQLLQQRQQQRLQYFRERQLYQIRVEEPLQPQQNPNGDTGRIFLIRKIVAWIVSLLIVTLAILLAYGYATADISQHKAKLPVPYEFMDRRMDPQPDSSDIGPKSDKHYSSSASSFRPGLAFLMTLLLILFM